MTTRLEHGWFNTTLTEPSAWLAREVAHALGPDVDVQPGPGAAVLVEVPTDDVPGGEIVFSVRPVAHGVDGWSMSDEGRWLCDYEEGDVEQILGHEKVAEALNAIRHSPDAAMQTGAVFARSRDAAGLGKALHGMLAAAQAIAAAAEDLDLRWDRRFRPAT